MTGATIFVMYSDGNGNVTISPRDGIGHVQPGFNSTRMSGVTLLEGSGISGGMMTANVKCLFSPFLYHPCPYRSGVLRCGR
jgi:hypothetical protein